MKNKLHPEITKAIDWFYSFSNMDRIKMYEEWKKSLEEDDKRSSLHISIFVKDTQSISDLYYWFISKS